MKTDVSIPMPDSSENGGDARAFVFTPDPNSEAGGDGPWPAAILYMDAPAIRPAMFEMGERLAQAGYYVLLPDVFWRAGPYPPLDIVKARAGDPEMGALFAKLRASTNANLQMQDTGVYLTWLESQPKAKARKVGVTGYCMGGRIAVVAAGLFPDRIAAAGSFHPGGLVTDGPDSPHLLAPKIKARVHVGGADEDAHFTREHCDALAKAFKDAGVKGEVEIYDGAKHGYTMPDMQVYNEPAAERHWREMFDLFDSTLKQA